MAKTVKELETKLHDLLDDVEVTIKKKVRWGYVIALLIISAIGSLGYTQYQVVSQQNEILESTRSIKVEVTQGSYTRAILLTGIRDYSDEELYNFKVVNAIIKYGKEYNINPFLVYGMIAQESAFKSKIVNSYGATGLMQVVGRIWVRELIEQGIITKQSDLLDPVKNIRAGCYILKKVKYNLTAYSGGATNYKQKIDKHIATAKHHALN